MSEKDPLGAVFAHPRFLRLVKVSSREYRLALRAAGDTFLAPSKHAFEFRGTLDTVVMRATEEIRKGE